MRKVMLDDRSCCCTHCFFNVVLSIGAGLTLLLLHFNKDSLKCDYSEEIDTCKCYRTTHDGGLVLMRRKSPSNGHEKTVGNGVSYDSSGNLLVEKIGCKELAVEGNTSESTGGDRSFHAKLDLSGNAINIVEDGFFRRMHYLEHLHLDDNNLPVFSWYSFDGLTKLRKLTLRANKMTTWTTQRTLPSRSTTKAIFPNLRHLDIGFNLFSSLSRNFTAHFPEIKYFNVESNLIEFIAKDTFFSTKSLETLILRNNKLRIPHVEWFRMSNLQFRAEVQGNLWNCNKDILPYAFSFVQTHLESNKSQRSLPTLICFSPAKYRGAVLELSLTECIKREIDPCPLIQSKEWKTVNTRTHNHSTGMSYLTIVFVSGFLISLIANLTIVAFFVRKRAKKLREKRDIPSCNSPIIRHSNDNDEQVSTRSSRRSSLDLVTSVLFDMIRSAISGSCTRSECVQFNAVEESERLCERSCYDNGTFPGDPAFAEDVSTEMNQTQEYTVRQETPFSNCHPKPPSTITSCVSLSASNNPEERAQNNQNRESHDHLPWNATDSRLDERVERSENPRRSKELDSIKSAHGKNVCYLLPEVSLRQDMPQLCRWNAAHSLDKLANTFDTPPTTPVATNACLSDGQECYVGNELCPSPLSQFSSGHLSVFTFSEAASLTSQDSGCTGFTSSHVDV